MKITKEMIDPKYYEELRIEVDKLTGPEGGIGAGGRSQYMEYPTKTSKRKFIMQDHWRGKSVHIDFRMEVNDHLVGWTILDNPPGAMDVTSIEDAKKMFRTLDWKLTWKKQKIGLRAETKARQPKEWLKVQGVVKPGGVGATKTKPAVFLVIEKGTFWEGAQKPYFHEYFIKSELGNIIPKNKWIRIIMRGIRVTKVDPETKKPMKGKYEMMWRTMIPSDQTAYALKRGIKKQWKPPVGIIPIPPDQRKGELWEKWQAFMKGKITPQKEKEEKENLAPFGDYKSFADCIAKNQDKRDPKAYCAVIRRKIRKEEIARSLEELPFAGFKDFADCVKKCKKKGKVTDCEAWCAVIRRKIEGSKNYCEDCLNYEICSDYGLPDQLACNNFKVKEKLTKGRFTLHFHSWMGQVVIRAVPHIEYYLRLELGGKVRSWFINGNPTRISPLAATYEGTVSKKWMTFEGKIKPGQEYNPTKTLISQMVITDSGSVDIEEETENGKKILLLKFNGKKLKGTWKLEQEEKSSDMFSFSKIVTQELNAGRFVFHRHYWDEKEHWDVRIKLNDRPKILIEFNLWKNPLEVEIEEPIKALAKQCDDPEKWFITEGTKIPKKVYGIDTFIDVLDTGKFTLIEYKEGFLSMKFFGEKLRGYWVLKTDVNGKFYFTKSRLPETHSLSGEPKDGDFYKPFLREQKMGLDYYWTRIYNIQRFTKCVGDWKTYLPDLKLPDFIEDLLVCLYFRPGTTHGARVTAVKVKGADTDFAKVSKWIKINKLHTWNGKQEKEEKETNKSVPLGEWESFEACVKANQDKDNPEEYCAAIGRKIAKKKLIKEKSLKASK